MTKAFIPTKDAVTLSEQSAAVLRAASQLMKTITEDLPADKRMSLLAVLDGGGRVGLEVTVDRNSDNAVSLISVEREGFRHVLATVMTIGNRGEKVAH